MREARLLSELESASFPQFFEYGEANGRAYFVMELLEPGDLPTGDREVARFLRQVCGAVAELHALLADRCFAGKPPRAWRRIIERATSSIPERRYPSVTAFIHAIRRRNFLRTAGFCASAALLLAAIAAGVVAWLAMGGGEWIKWRMLCERGKIVSVEEKSEPYESPVYGKCHRIFHVPMSWKEQSSIFRRGRCRSKSR